DRIARVVVEGYAAELRVVHDEVRRKPSVRQKTAALTGNLRRRIQAVGHGCKVAVGDIGSIGRALTQVHRTGLQDVAHNGSASSETGNTGVEVEPLQHLIE